MLNLNEPQKGSSTKSLQRGVILAYFKTYVSSTCQIHRAKLVNNNLNCPIPLFQSSHCIFTTFCIRNNMFWYKGWTEISQHMKDPTCLVQNLKGARQMKQQIVGRQQMASLLDKLNAPTLGSAVRVATATLRHVILTKDTFLTLPHQGSHLETLCD